MSFLESRLNQPPQYRTNTWIKINGNTKTRNYVAADQIQFKLQC